MTLNEGMRRAIGSERMPKPNQLARIYYEPELDQMIDDIETALKSTRGRPGQTS